MSVDVTPWALWNYELSKSFLFLYKLSSPKNFIEIIGNRPAPAQHAPPSTLEDVVGCWGCRSGGLVAKVIRGWQ